jgi:hypothetical protein
MESTRERALGGLIELWADVYKTETYSIKGKQFTAGQLKPYVKAALAEPGSSVQGFFEASPEIARACATYADLPTGLRKIILILARKEIEDKLYLLKRLFHLFAVLYITGGITAAETERRLEQSFKHVVDRITLKELLNKPAESNLHTLLEALPLFPGSIAGADKHLNRVLVSHCKEVSGATTYYEQDLKVALWNCWKGKHVDEAIKMLSKQGDPTERMSTLRRILDGEEPELLRRMLLATLRQTMEDLPDIADIIKDRRNQKYHLQKLERMRKQDETLGSVFIRDEAVLENIEAKPGELREKLSPDEIIELLRKKGINKNDLTEKMWRFIFRLNDAFHEGAEIGSKKGLSLHAYFGDSSVTTRKQLSRLRDRVNRTRAKQPRA